MPEISAKISKYLEWVNPDKTACKSEIALLVSMKPIFKTPKILESLCCLGQALYDAQPAMCVYMVKLMDMYFILFFGRLVV